MSKTHTYFSEVEEVFGGFMEKKDRQYNLDEEFKQLQYLQAHEGTRQQVWRP